MSFPSHLAKGKIDEPVSCTTVALFFSLVIIDVLKKPIWAGMSIHTIVHFPFISSHFTTHISFKSLCPVQ